MCHLDIFLHLNNISIAILGLKSQTRSYSDKNCAAEVSEQFYKLSILAHFEFQGVIWKAFDLPHNCWVLNYQLIRQENHNMRRKWLKKNLTTFNQNLESLKTYSESAEPLFQYLLLVTDLYSLLLLLPLKSEKRFKRVFSLCVPLCIHCQKEQCYIYSQVVLY